MEYSAAILRNKGVQVEVAVLDEGGHPLTTSDGEAKTEQRWVRFDSNCIADLEDIYGNLGAFEAATRTTPFKAVRQALASAWEIDTKVAGRMMIDGRIGDYATAVGVALALANGVDPTQAGRLLRIGVKASERQATERDKQLAEVIAEGEAELEKNETEPEPSDDSGTVEVGSPGTSGSEAGSEPDATGTSSGG